MPKIHVHIIVTLLKYIIIVDIKVQFFVHIKQRQTEITERGNNCDATISGYYLVFKTLAGLCHSSSTKPKYSSCGSFTLKVISLSLRLLYPV